MQYTISDFAGKCRVHQDVVLQALKFGLINQIENEAGYAEIVFDTASEQFYKFVTENDVIDEHGRLTLPIMKPMRGKRVKIINKICIYERWFINNFNYLIRTPDNKQIIFYTYKEAVDYAVSNTQYTKRAVNAKRNGIRYTSFTEHELELILMHLPRTTATKYLVSKLQKQLTKIRGSK